PATPGDWGALPVGATPLVATRPGASAGWSIAALVGCVLSMVGAFLPLLSVGDRSVDRDRIGIEVVVPWEFRDRYTGSLLIERWDVAFALLLLGAVAAVLLLSVRRQVWPAAAGALLAAVAFHLQLSIVQRAEMFGLQRLQSPTYELGGILTVVGAFVALVGFIVVLARRH
ncbi:MAG: hypothetical protein ABMA25_16775, partial [Ilumatobacteraceae bacterium]